MKKTDVRFSDSDMAAIQSMVGKRMVKFKCDPFEFSTSVYGIVGVAFEDASYAFTNLVEVMDYFGVQEDVALFKMQQTPFSSICSFVRDQTTIETPIESVVTEVIVVNELQKLFENGAQTCETRLTRGIVFKFEEGYELSFEKNIWFSEDITVGKGYNLIDRFTPASEFEEGWSGPLRGECFREIILLK